VPLGVVTVTATGPAIRPGGVMNDSVVPSVLMALGRR